ncbi:MAG: glycerophosphodiester phosphodiesterase family protein [Traorella sp.]
MNLVIILLCLILLYIYCIFPRFSKSKEFKPYTNYIYAHRGLHNQDYPENTLAAFERAKNYGYGIELDVQLTKDQIPVIAHDFHLKRICGIDKQIDECTYEELLNYPILNSTYTIPKLEDVLKIIDHRIPMIVEIKQKSLNCQVCIETQKLLDTYQNNYVIESFNPLALNWYRKHRPQLIRGQLSCDHLKDPNLNKALAWFLKHCLANFLSRPDFIAYDVNSRKELSFSILKHFIYSVLWTIQDKNTFLEVKDQYDILIFENFIVEKK